MKAQDVSTVAVIGAGTMGAGIAGLFARAGCGVHLVDVGKAQLKRGLQRLDLAQQALIEAKLLSIREAAAARKRIQPLTSLEIACRDADFLVEAVLEEMPLKKKMYRDFETLCPKGTVLASNTSGLSITEMASAIKQRGRVVGMHFWNPPHLIPLVEVTRGRETSPAAAKLVMELARRIGKEPVMVKREVPGFIGNRIQFAVFREALHLLNEGVASAEDIDTAVRAGPGLRWAYMGPLRTADLGGLDIFHAISTYLFAELAGNKKPRGDLGKLVRQGNLGAKTGRGFYKYAGRDLGRAIARRDRVLLEFLKALQEDAER